MPKSTISIGDLVTVQAPSQRAQLQEGAMCKALSPQSSSTICVPELWPQEQAQVRILARSRHQDLYFAKLHTLESGHPHRVDPPCEHHPLRDAKPACGGCPWMSLSVPAQRELKLEILRNQLQHPIQEIHGAQDLGYRYASKRVVHRVRGRLALGSYVPKTHQLAPMRHCQVDHPLLRDAFNQCEDLLIAHRVAPYDESIKEGEVRFVWGKCNGAAVHLTVIGAHDRSPRLQSTLVALGQALGPQSAISWQLHPPGSNAMRADTPCERIDQGPSLPSLELLGQRVELDALGFLQPNPLVAQDCYRTLLGENLDHPWTGSLALDLYAGAGATSLALASRFDRVLACERSPGPSAASMVQACSVEDFLSAFDPQAQGIPDLVVANPPRAGLSPSACEALVRIAAPRLSIMSCGPKALAKNLEQLCQAGYAITHLAAFDPLPHTAHVEVVAQLGRRETQESPQ